MHGRRDSSVIKFGDDPSSDPRRLRARYRRHRRCRNTLATSLGAVLKNVGLGVTIGKEPTSGPWGTKLRQSAIEGRLIPRRNSATSCSIAANMSNR